jgi:hypothetical protein
MLKVTENDHISTLVVPYPYPFIRLAENMRNPAIFSSSPVTRQLETLFC